MSSVAKVVEVIGESPKNFDDAVRNAVRESAKTIKNIKSVWVDNMSGWSRAAKLSPSEPTSRCPSR